LSDKNYCTLTARSSSSLRAKRNCTSSTFLSWGTLWGTPWAIAPLRLPRLGGRDLGVPCVVLGSLPPETRLNVRSCTNRTSRLLKRSRPLRNYFSHLRAKGPMRMIDGLLMDEWIKTTVFGLYAGLPRISSLAPLVEIPIPPFNSRLRLS
jgi:hypothetical protein